MAAQDPIVLGLSADFKFKQAAETGVIGFTFSEGESRTEMFVYDGSVGYDTGAVLHNPVMTFNVNGYINGTNGIVAAAIGSTLAIANATSGTGTIVCNGVTRDHAPGDGKKIAATAWRRPGISIGS